MFETAYAGELDRPRLTELREGVLDLERGRGTPEDVISGISSRIEACEPLRRGPSGGGGPFPRNSPGKRGSVSSLALCAALASC